MFDTATRLKLRFNYKGASTVEDLWDLSLDALDVIYSNLETEAEKRAGKSLRATKTKEDDVLALKIEIVKHIFTVKDTERKSRLQATQDKAFNDKVDEMIARKQDDELLSLSVDELKKLKK